MAEIDAVLEAVSRFSPENWATRGLPDPEIGPPPGDPLFEFVHWHARAVQRDLKFRLPGERGRRGRRAGADLANLVDRLFIAPPATDLPPEIISESQAPIVVARARELVEAIFNSYFISLRGEPTKAYLVALYTWLGCAGVARPLRPIFTVASEGTESKESAQRLADYAWIKRRWEAEDRRGNPWVRLGTESARLYKEARNEPIQDRWVPTDSPYWRGRQDPSRLTPSFSLHGAVHPT